MRSAVGALLAGLAMGCGSRSSDGLQELAEIGGVYGVPNLDDDDGDGVRDFRDERVPGDNDLSTLDLSLVREGMKRRDELQLVLQGDDVSGIRVWNGDVLLLSDDLSEVTLTRDEVPPSLQIEFRDFLDRGTLGIIHRRPERNLLWRRSEARQRYEQIELELLASPLILNHHLQPAEVSYVLEGVPDLSYTYYGYLYSFDNAAMMGAMRDSLGPALVYEDLFDYYGDVWVQDEFENATVTSPESRIDVVIDSIRDRGLDDYPELVVADHPDSVVRTWGSGYPSSQDSFGNLEVSPPVTVDGVTYPFGRIYWGRWEGVGLVPALDDLLRSQRVQAPFVVDVSFLLVGHIDEFTTFLPDSTSPKGFRLYVGDTDLGMAFLDALPPGADLDPRYDRDHGFSSILQMRDSGVLRDLNEDYQRDYIEPAIDRMKRELGLTDDDIVRVPAVFEEVGGPYAAALIPGTVNMLVHTHPDGQATAFLPDPFLRPEGAGIEDDPFVAEIEALLPPDVEPVWVDNWDMYHIALGEVHCGTNARRTPLANWWEDALHLLPDGDE